MVAPEGVNMPDPGGVCGGKASPIRKGQAPEGREKGKHLCLSVSVQAFAFQHPAGRRRTGGWGPRGPGTSGAGPCAALLGSPPGDILLPTATIAGRGVGSNLQKSSGSSPQRRPASPSIVTLPGCPDIAFYGPLPTPLPIIFKHRGCAELRALTISSAAIKSLLPLHKVPKKYALGGVGEWGRAGRTAGKGVPRFGEGAGGVSWV